MLRKRISLILAVVIALACLSGCSNLIQIEGWREVILDVPVYSQYEVEVDGINNLCWAACMAMYTSAVLDDEVNRTKEIAVQVTGSETNYNVPSPWCSTHTLDIEGMEDELQVEITRQLTKGEVMAAIDHGKPFAMGFRGADMTGHMMICFGYRYDTVNGGLVLHCIDPKLGMVQSYTYEEDLSYGDLKWVSVEVDWDFYLKYSVKVTAEYAEEQK